jgi:hypothetical protein
MERNPDLNTNTVENIERLMYALRPATGENVPMAIPPSHPYQSVDSQQNQGSTRQGSQDPAYFSGQSTHSAEQNSQSSTQSDPLQPFTSIQCTRCEYIPDRTGTDSDRKGNLKRHQKFKHDCADVEKRTCPVCDKVLSRPDNVLTHLRTMHAEG